ncbi:hypothetical protein HYU19_05240 [Candidatus Woesearchaeota archaeon]|nr:hypothetical protein [Candidatus Woesearchaeota archaeon]
MNPHKTIFYQALLESYRKFWTDKLHIAVTLLLDFVFFVLLAILFTFFYERMLPHIVSIYQLVGNAPSGVSDEAAVRSFVESFDSARFWEEYRVFLRLGIQFLAAALGLWIVFHAMAWKRAHELMTRKMEYGHVIKKFALITAAWAVAVGVFFYASLKVSLSTVIWLSLISPGVFKAVFLLVSLIFLYILLVSYAVLDEYKIEHVMRASFHVGVRKAHILVPGFVLILAKFWLIHFFVVRFVGYSVTATAIGGLVVILLVLAWARLFMTSLSHRLVMDLKKADAKLERKLRKN